MAKPVKLVDKRFLFNETPINTFTSGVKEITLISEKAQTSTNAVLQFNVKPPGLIFGLKRELLCKYRISVQLTGPADDWFTENPLSASRQVALRAYPLHSVCSQMRITINGAPFNWQPNVVLDPLRRYDQNQNNLEHAANSTWPTMLDDVSDYNLAKESARDPVQPRGNDNGVLPLTRGAFLPIEVVQDPTNKALYTLTWEIWEPLVFPKLFGTQGFEDSVIVGINSIDIYLSFSQSMERIISTNFDDANIRANYTVSNVSFATTPELLLQWYTPSPDLSLPEVFAVPYVDFDYDQNKFGVVERNAKRTFTSNSYSLVQVPYAVMVYVRDDVDVSQGANGHISRYPDVYANISRVEIQFNNRSNMLSSLDEVALHQIAVRNGFAHAWYSWNTGAQGTADDDDPVGDQAGGCGSVLVLKFGDDIPLDGVYPTTEGKFNFRMTVEATNKTGHNFVNATLNVVFIYDGMITMTPSGQIVNKRISMSQEEAKSTKFDLELSKSVSLHDRMIRGHGLLDIFRTVGSTLSNLLRRGLGVAARHLPGFVSKVAEGKPLKQAAVETAGEVGKSVIDEAVGSITKPSATVAGGRRPRRLKGRGLALVADLDPNEVL